MTNVIYLPLRDLPNLLADKNFDKTAPSVVYVHGWMESGRMDLSVLAIRGAYLDRGDHNVISIDWSHYSKNIQYHVSVVPQLKVIAETIADAIYSLVKKGLDIDTPGLHLVGHSLGYARELVEFHDFKCFFFVRGQMVGKIGRHLKFLSDSKVVVPRIFALDPAGEFKKY